MHGEILRGFCREFHALHEVQGCWCHSDITMTPLLDEVTEESLVFLLQLIGKKSR